MKKCPFCGSANSDNSKKCYNCNENIDIEVSSERQDFVNGKTDSVNSRNNKEKKEIENPLVLPAGCSRAIEIAVSCIITGIVMGTFKLGAIPAIIVFLVSLVIGEAVANIFRK